MNRMVAPALAILILPLGRLASRQYAIDYQTQAIPLKKSLVDVSKLFGEDLTCAPDIGENFVTVSVHGVLTKDLETHIADAVSGKWVKNGAGLKLIYDTDLISKRKRERLADIARLFRQAQGRLRQGLDRHPEFGRSQAEALLGQMDRLDRAYEDADGATPAGQPFLDDLTPGQRAVTRIVCGLDPNSLAALPRGISVFSSQPTKFQHPLQRIDEALQLLSREQATWLEAFRNRPNDSPPKKVWLSADPRSYLEPISPGETVCLVRVHHPPVMGPTLIEVYFADQTGRVLMYGARNLEAIPAIPSATTADSAAISTPADALDFFRATGFCRGLSRERPTWQSKLIHCDETDPLALGTSRVLIEAAAQENLVACLPDSAIGTGRFAWDGRGQPVTAATFWSLCAFDGLDVRAGSGWRVVRPDLPEQPASRTALKRLLTNLSDSGGLRLDDVADYADRTGGQFAPALLAPCLDGVLPGASKLVRDPWQVLQFYGALTGVQREEISGGGQILLQNLPSRARETLLDYLAKLPWGALQRFDADGSAILDRELTLWQDPTVALASGISAEGFLAGTRTRRMGAVLFGKPNGVDEPAIQPMDLRWVAMEQLSESIPSLKPFDRLEGARPSGAIPGYESTLTLAIRLRPDLGCRCTLWDPEYDLRRAPLPLDRLPEEYRSNLERAEQDVRRSSSVGGAGSGARTPPP